MPLYRDGTSSCIATQRSGAAVNFEEPIWWRRRVLASHVATSSSSRRPSSRRFSEAKYERRIDVSGCCFCCRILREPTFCCYRSHPLRAAPRRSAPLRAAPVSSSRGFDCEQVGGGGAKKLKPARTCGCDAKGPHKDKCSEADPKRRAAHEGLSATKKQRKDYLSEADSRRRAAKPARVQRGNLRGSLALGRRSDMARRPRSVGHVSPSLPFADYV